jgi:membrane protein
MVKVIKDVKALIFRFKDDEVMALSSQLAYSLILSFFPFLIFLMTLVGYSSIKSTNVLASLSTILPRNAYELTEKTIVEIVDTRQGNLLSFSLIVTIWSASAGFSAVIRGLNKAYDEEEKRGYIKLQFLSILCTIVLVFIILFSFLLLVLGEVLGNYIACCYKFSGLYRSLLDISRYVIMVVAMIFGFAALYHYTPARRLTWKEVLPGALFTTAGWIITSFGFSYYVNNFNNYSRVYGSIGAVIVLMTWLFISSIIIIMGGELNATLAFDREGKEKPKGKRF